MVLFYRKASKFPNPNPFNTFTNKIIFYFCIPEVGSKTQKCDEREHECSPGGDLDGHVAPEMRHEVRQRKGHHQDGDHGGGQQVKGHRVYVVDVNFLDCQRDNFLAR
jgi:hypothetical protein